MNSSLDYELDIAIEMHRLKKLSAAYDIKPSSELWKDIAFSISYIYDMILSKDKV